MNAFIEKSHLHYVDDFSSLEKQIFTQLERIRHKCELLSTEIKSKNIIDLSKERK